jgi:hypothetical protein
MNVVIQSAATRRSLGHQNEPAQGQQIEVDPELSQSAGVSLKDKYREPDHDYA